MEEKEIKFKKELDFILSTKIFFKKPNNNKILWYASLYVFFVILGSALGLYMLTSIITLPLLVYVLAAKGKNYFIPLVFLTGFNIYIVSSLDAFVWNLINIILAGMIYYFIKYRYSKLFILMVVSGFVFFGITLYLHILFSTSVINYSPEAIQMFIDAYISQMSSLQPETDVDLFREAFEQVKRFIPTLIFMFTIGYSLVLINYTFFVLAREKAIVPVFPKFKLVAIGRNISYFYMAVTFVVLLMAISNVDLYNPYYLFFDNVYSIFRWIFVFNGVCTLFFFIEEKFKSSSGFLKGLTVISAYLFSGIFDLIGLVDSLMRLREKYVRMKGDR